MAMSPARVAARAAADLERPSPRALLDYYGAQFAVEFAVQIAYRGALLIWLISLVTQPLISLVVCTTVAQANGGSAGGITTGEYAAYFVAVMVVNQLTFTWHAWEFEWRVRTGYFSPILLRPIHPVHNDIAQNLTFKALTFVVLLPTAVGLGFAFGADFNPSTWDIIAVVPALILAMGLRFFVEWSLALAAFWLTRTQAINQVFGVATFFLAGQAAPLTLFPEPVQIIAAILPFRWMLAFPVELLLGGLSRPEILRGLLVQAGWIALALALMRALWARG